ncbi:MAG: PatB family C-S lyase [Anaerolineae bacterium]|jgi:cystathionine beta-lyase
MVYNFDEIIDRRGTESAKWHRYEGEDLLPLWVADMDFRSPEPVIEALRQRVDHGIFGYPQELVDLRPVFVERLEQLYGWRVDAEAVILLPGVVNGFNMAIQAVTAPGDGVLAQTPVYYPILWAPPNARCTLEQMELTRRPDGQYEIDFDRFEATITPRTRIFVLCNPHNPVGRVFRREELARMAEICLRHDVVICSDEIHSDLVFSGHDHLPIASLDPEIGRRTITLMAPSKTYNIAGLQCAVAIVEDETLRKQYQAARRGLVPWVNLLGQVAALAAYRDGDDWLAAVMAYMEANREILYDYVAAELPGVEMARPEGTYLAWLDCRGADLPGNAHKFFLEDARVVLNDGATFGRGGEGFVRLNFGCPRATLEEALERMKRALAGG